MTTLFQIVKRSSERIGGFGGKIQGNIIENILIKRRNWGKRARTVSGILASDRIWKKLRKAEENLKDTIRRTGGEREDHQSVEIVGGGVEDQVERVGHWEKESDWQVG